MGNKMWRVPAGSAQEILSYNRWSLALYPIQALSMAVVLVRTYKHSKYPYLYTVATLIFLSASFGLLAIILYNWVEGCKYFYAENDKCHGQPSQDWLANVRMFNNLCSGLADICYFNGHFLFAYRYFEVAEMFGREDKTLAKHEKNRAITRKISYVIVAVITLNSLIEIANKCIYRRITGEYSHSLYNWTYHIIPGVFLLGFCLLLLVALLWICHSLRHDK
jgi:hypothetical protein